MRILLINPPHNKTIYASVPKIFYELRGTHPPLGLLYLSSYLLKKQPNHCVKIYDTSAENHSLNQIKESIERFKPDIVGIQALSLSMLDVIDVLEIVKKINKRIITIVGGAHPTLYPIETTALKDIDYSIIGEGEISFHKLIKNITDDKKDFSEIKGIAYKKDGEVFINKSRENIENIDIIPPINRNLLPLNKYTSAFVTGKKSTNMVTSRGCPYRCIFCFNESIHRTHSPEYVLEDIKNCLKLGIKEIFLVDDTFSLNLNRAKKICHYIIEEKLKFSWYINTRINTVDDELLHLFKKAGCKQINYGIESGSQKIIEILNKKIDLSEAKKCIKATKKAGIKVLCYFMIGLPEETKKDINLTVKFIKETKPDFIRFSVTTLEPGTELYKLGLEKGIINHDVWKDFAKNPRNGFKAPLWTENFNEDELHNLLKIISKNYYLSPNYIIKNLLDIKNWFNFKKNFKTFIRLLKF